MEDLLVSKSEEVLGSSPNFTEITFFFLPSSKPLVSNIRIIELKIECLYLVFYTYGVIMNRVQLGTGLQVHKRALDLCSQG